MQQQQEMLHLGEDLNEQNKERLQIYQATRTPLEQYEEQVAKLNLLYSDHSSQEYTRALEDAKEKMLGLYDPAQKLEKEMRQLREEQQSGLLSWDAYKEKLKQVQLAMDQLKLNSANALQGMKLFFEESLANAKSWGQQTHDALQQVFSGIQNSMATAFTQMIMGTKTVGQAFAEMGRNMLQSVVQACAQMLAQWITTHLVMAAIAAVTGTSDDSTAAQAATKIAANAAIAQSDAGVAAANTLALMSATTPPPGPEIAAAIVLAQGEAFASLASAAGGMNVDRDQLAFIHKDEKVLPATTSRGFDRIIDSFRTPQPGAGHMAFAGAGGGGGNAAGFDRLMGPMTLHVHGASDPMASANAASRVMNARMKTLGKKLGVKL